MKKKITLILVTVLLLLAFTSVGVLAAYLLEKDVDCGVTILAPEPNLGVYVDPECTIVAEYINFGELHADESNVQTIYLKNIGQVDFTSVGIGSYLPADVGALSYDTIFFPLPVGSVQEMNITLTVVSEPTLGQCDFFVRFRCN